SRSQLLAATEGAARTAGFRWHIQYNQRPHMVKGVFVRLPRRRFARSRPARAVAARDLPPRAIPPPSLALDEASQAPSALRGSIHIDAFRRDEISRPSSRAAIVRRNSRSP